VTKPPQSPSLEGDIRGSSELGRGDSVHLLIVGGKSLLPFRLGHDQEFHAGVLRTVPPVLLPRQARLQGRSKASVAKWREINRLLG